MIEDIFDRTSFMGHLRRGTHNGRSYITLNVERKERCVIIECIIMNYFVL